MKNAIFVFFLFFTSLTFADEPVDFYSANLFQTAVFCKKMPNVCKSFLAGFILGLSDIGHLYTAEPQNIPFGLDGMFPCFGDKNNRLHDIPGSNLAFNRGLLYENMDDIYKKYMRFLSKKIESSTITQIKDSRSMDFNLEFLVKNYSCPIPAKKLQRPGDD